MIALGGNKLTLVAALALLATLVAGSGVLLVRSDSVTECLDEFKRERDQRQALDQLATTEFCQHDESQMDWLKNIKLYHSGGQDAASHMEAAIQYMDARDRLTRSMITELIKSLSPICGSFMSNIVWQIESKYSLKNEYTLRETIGQLVTSSRNNLNDLTLGDDFYPYCNLMTFKDAGALVEQIRVQLEDKKWPAEEYEVIYARETQLKECLDVLEQAYFNMDKAKFRLVEVFSEAVSSFRQHRTYNYLLMSFKFGIEPLLISRELGGCWRLSEQEKLVEAMRRRFGKKKSRSEIGDLIKRELVPACGAFFGKFKDVFQSKHTGNNSGSIVEKLENNQDIRSVKSYVKVWGIYHDCYFLVKGDFEAFSNLIGMRT